MTENNLTLSILEKFAYIGVPSDAKGLDLQAILRHLGALGCHDVWVEAGARLFTALHCAGLVNRTYLYVTPQVLGPHAVPAYLEKTIFQQQHSVSWHAFEEDAMLTIEWQGERHVS